jgi:2-oxoglutarate ferredoxin oxidoreductase subunit alpha
VLADANIAALNAGHAYGETAEIGGQVKKLHIDPVPSAPGLYRTITGAEAISLGLVAGAQMADLPMFFGGYPITPASAILHYLTKMKEFGVTTFQAEDEIAAIASAVGAAYAGSLGVTSSSGPGIALKGEAMGLAVMTELPLVIVNSQRGGPSTGLPTKTEQSDLYQAIYGRNGDTPMPVIAARSPADAFECAIEAVPHRHPVHDPVMLLTDGYIGNAAEPWHVPDPDLQALPGEVPQETNNEGGKVLPYKRDENGVRPWIKPGTPGLMHRIGGIEKAVDTGDLDSPATHQFQTDARKDKVDGIAHHVPAQDIDQGTRAASWRSSAGAAPMARSVRPCAAPAPRVWTSATSMSAMSGRCPPIWATCSRLRKMLVPEMNTGQFKTVLRDQYLVDAKPLNKVSGQPFTIAEIEAAIEAALA